MAFDVRQRQVSKRMSPVGEYKRSPEMSPEGLESARDIDATWLKTVDHYTLWSLCQTTFQAAPNRPLAVAELLRRGGVESSNLHDKALAAVAAKVRVESYKRLPLTEKEIAFHRKLVRVRDGVPMHDFISMRMRIDLNKEFRFRTSHAGPSKMCLMSLEAPIISWDQECGETSFALPNDDVSFDNLEVWERSWDRSIKGIYC